MIPEKFRRKALAKLSENVADGIPKFKPFLSTPRFVKAVREFYFGNGAITLSKSLPGFAKIAADMSFLLPLEDFATLHIRHKKAPFFSYMFTHDSDYSNARQTLSFAPPQGASHGDFINGHIFYKERNGVKADEPAFQTAMRVTKMWANFVQTGNPTPDDSLRVKWLPRTNDSHNYLNIGPELLVEKDMKADSVQFWKHAREQENFFV